MAKKAKTATDDGGPVLVKFAFERSTKNTHRFNEVDAKSGKVIDLKDRGAKFAIGTLYVQKSVLGEDAPAELELLINR
jgi:hypothetical protein